MVKRITFLDLEGRYRMATPAIRAGMTEDEAIERFWAILLSQPGLGLPANHPHFVVDDADLIAGKAEREGQYFRYGAQMKPRRDGKLAADGSVELARDARDGAWEMGPTGLPVVNMDRARLVQMDYIRKERSPQLVALDDVQGRAVGRGDNAERDSVEVEKQVLRDLPATFDLTTFVTPATLRAAWPTELPDRA